MSRIIKVIIVVIHFPLFFLSRFIKKRNDVWIFGAWYGHKYSDNSRVVFEHASKDTRLKIIWLTKSTKLVKEIRNKGYIAYHAFSLRGYFYSLIASRVIITQSLMADVNPFLASKNTLKIQLWHGVPLKKIGNDIERKVQPMKWLFNLLNYFDNLKYDFVIATSERDAKNMSTAFQVPLSKVKILGYPRNDVLLNKPKINSVKRILYAPTFRGGKGDSFDFFYKYNFSVSKLELILKDKNAILDFKMHPANLPDEKIINEIDESLCINFLGNIELNEILMNYDVLITDYSGAYIDYLLLDRPIIFSAFDLSEYINNRGLYYKYEDAICGLIAKDWSEVFSEIENILDGNDDYKAQRLNILNFFHLNQDNRSCERVFEEIKNLKISS